MSLPQRKSSLRHPGWSYDASGAYFVTICTHKREHLFVQKPYEAVATTMWQRLPTFNTGVAVTLDDWVVMPNHIHGILWLHQQTRESEQPARTRRGTLSVSIGTFKAAVTFRINRIRQSPGGKVWQRGYYDRIICSDCELQRIRQYIRLNPSRWSRRGDSDLDELLARMQSKP